MANFDWTQGMEDSLGGVIKHNGVLFDKNNQLADIHLVMEYVLTNTKNDYDTLAQLGEGASLCGVASTTVGEIKHAHLTAVRVTTKNRTKSAVDQIKENINKTSKNL